jgi:hypothetical protein
MSPFVLPLIFAQAIPIPIPVIPPPRLNPTQILPTQTLPTTTPIEQPSQPQKISVAQPVRPLPGKLDSIPVLNSNNPELIFNEGIILSTLSSIGMGSPYAHLNYPFKGRFDVFVHHVVQDSPQRRDRTLYVGVLLHNDSRKPVKIDVLQGAGYITSNAPFLDLPSQVEDTNGKIFAGPGSRSMADILWGKRQSGVPAQIILQPGQSQMLLNMPVPVNSTDLNRNGISAYFRLKSDGDVYAASMAMYSQKNSMGQDSPPSLENWKTLLKTSRLMTPRDRIPRNSQRRIYSRVAGVSLGSQWQATLTDTPNATSLSIPAQGRAFSYPISTLEGGKLGTNQSQAAKMAVRYADSAYESHGNYGTQYSLSLPLYNSTQQTQQVGIAIETPLKQDQITDGQLQFLIPPAKNVFFRGTVKITYPDDNGKPLTRYFHLVQRRGQRGDPLINLTMRPGDRRLVQVELVYPPDSTPPQILTVRTQ